MLIAIALRRSRIGDWVGRKTYGRGDIVRS